jgi:hypothetical protein
MNALLSSLVCFSCSLQFQTYCCYGDGQLMENVYIICQQDFICELHANRLTKDLKPQQPNLKFYWKSSQIRI